MSRSDRARQRYLAHFTTQQLVELLEAAATLCELAAPAAAAETPCPAPTGRADLDEITENVLELTKKGIEEIDAREAAIAELRAENDRLRRVLAARDSDERFLRGNLAKQCDENDRLRKAMTSVQDESDENVRRLRDLQEELDERRNETGQLSWRDTVTGEMCWYPSPAFPDAPLHAGNHARVGQAVAAFFDMYRSWEIQRVRKQRNEARRLAHRAACLALAYVKFPSTDFREELGRYDDILSLTRAFIRTGEDLYGRDVHETALRAREKVVARATDALKAVHRDR